MVETNEFLQLFLETLIRVLVPALLSLAVVWLRNQVELAKVKLGDQRTEAIQNVISTLILAAEQSGLAQLIANEGPVKKAWVLNRAADELAKRNIPVDVERLADLVEAEVLNLKVEGVLGAAK